LSPTSSQTERTTVQKLSNGISPGKKVNLRSQYLSQLKTLQNLRDDGVLTQEEFQEEKMATPKFERNQVGNCLKLAIANSNHLILCVLVILLQAAPL